MEQNLKLEIAITDTLKDLGIPAHLNGYVLLKDAVLYGLSRNGEKFSMMQMYKYIGWRRRVEGHCVERNIRKAVEMAATRANPETWKEFFGFSVAAERGRPTNGEFVNTLVEYFRLREI